MIINILVYFKVIKNIFGTNEQDDYQVLSEKLQNFLLCLEMVLAAAGHHYSYPYQEHQINIPNYRSTNNFRQLLGPIFDVNDIMQDVREHMGAVKNSLTRPFRSADPFLESKQLLGGSRRVGVSSSSSGSSNLGDKFSSNGSGSYRNNAKGDEAVPGPSSARYGTVNYVMGSKQNSTIPIVQQTSQYHQGGPPSQFGNMFRSTNEAPPASTMRPGAFSSGSRMGDSSPATTTATASSSTTTNTQATVKKSESSNSNSWPSNSISDDVVNIEVKGLEVNLIQLPSTPPL